MTASKAKRTKTIKTEASQAITALAIQKQGPSKKAQVISMLREDNGATAKQIMDVTGWQKHTVRGFISGTVKKALALSVITEKSESGLVYKVSV